MSMIILKGFPYVANLTTRSDVLLTGIEGLPVGGGGSSASFVFKPGGVAGENVYDDWGLLCTAMGLVAGVKVLLFDDSIVTPCVVPPGVWDMEFVVWTGGNGRITEVVVIEGAEFLKLRSIAGLLRVEFTGGTAPVQDFSPLGTNPDLFVIQEGSTVGCGPTATGPFMALTNPGPAVIALVTGAEIFTLGVARVIDLSVAGAFLVVSGEVSGTLNDRTVSGVAGSVLFELILSTSAELSEIQTGFLGTIVQQIDTMGRVSLGNIVNGPAGPIQAVANEVFRADTNGGVVVVELPFAQNRRGKSIIVKDVGNAAGVNAINIITSAGDTIDGGPSASIGVNGGSFTFTSDGGINWLITGRV